jgi:hypothetical protein
MLEPEISSTTSEQEDEDIDTVMAIEKNKALRQLENDMTHLSLAQQMLLKITQEQNEKLDTASEHIEATTNITEAANQALFESEKMASERRKRNLFLGLVGGATVCIVGAVTALGILKSTHRL